MLTLYDYLPSQNAYKVRLLLNHLEHQYRTETVSIFEGEGQSEEYLRINPAGAVPALKLQDGSVLAESNAILIFLSEGSIYLPGDSYARAKVMQWLFFEADYVQSSVATLRHWIMTGKDKNRAPAEVQARHDGSLKTLSIIDRALDRCDFLAGESYTIADMSVFAYVHRAHEAELSLANFANVTRWINNVQLQPRFLAEVHPYSIDPYSVSELL